jgi:hypothetical protein
MVSLSAEVSRRPASEQPHHAKTQRLTLLGFERKRYYPHVPDDLAQFELARGQDQVDLDFCQRHREGHSYVLPFLTAGDNVRI